MKYALAAALTLASLAPAAAAPLTDVDAVPYLGNAQRAAYVRFLGVNLPRAVAIAPNGKIGWAGGAAMSETRAKATALANCAAAGGTGCALYGVGLDTVWPGAEYAPPKPPAPFYSNWDYAFLPDAHYVWTPPAEARGVFVWSHGTGGDLDSRGVEPPPWVRAFNLAGFDIVRFDRDPVDDHDADRAARWLADELAMMRRLGFRDVVAGGQSRGSWNSLQMLDHAGLADAIIAVSPAAQGTMSSGNLFSQNDDLRRILADAPPSATRVALVQFADDPFIEEPAARVRMLERLRSRFGGLLVIDRPPGFSGHLAAGSTAFEQRFGACLVRFATAAEAPATCPQ